MAHIFTTILNMSLTSSIVILVVLLARLCLKKAPKIYSYLLWAVVLFRLLCPVSFSLPVSVLAPVSEASTSTASTYTGSMEYISVPERPEPQHTQPPVQSEPPVQEENNDTPIIPEQNAPAAVVEQQAVKKSAGEIALTILGWVWAIGMVGVLGFTTWQTLALKRKLDTAFIIRGNIFESEQIDTAFILGVFNPKIYLPLGLPFDIQKAVVSHEQTHQRRGDHIVKLVSYIALAIHWFNPLVWISFKLMCDDMEKSCDEAVIRTMNERGYTMDSTKKAYGHMLLALGGGKQHIFSPVSFAENSTKARVKNVVAYNRVARNTAITLAVACALVALLCIFNPTGVAATTDVDDSTSSAENDINITLVNVNGTKYRSDETELVLSEAYDLSFLVNFPLLEHLEISCDGTADYSGLQHCKNLKQLDINTYRLDDISFLEHCPQLEYLGLHCTFISDLSPILHCTGLNELQLTGISSLKDYSPIGRLSNLKSLTLNVHHTLSQENISEINFSGMTQLEHLSYIDAGDLSFLRDIPNLRSLDARIFTDADIENIAAVSRLERLEFASFYYEEQETMLDFAPLRKLEKLEYVYAYTDSFWIRENVDNSKAAFDYISSSLLQALPADSIRSLELIGGYSITQESGKYLGRFANLESLVIDLFEGTYSLEFLSENKNLKELSICALYGNIHLNGTVKLPAIESLLVDGLNTDSFSEIGKLNNLKKLDIIIGYDGEEIIDASYLCELTKLESLRLDVDYISNASAMASLTELKSLDLTTALTDISWLASMENLEEVVLNDWKGSDGDYIEDGTVIETKIKQLDISSLSDKAGLKKLTLYGFLSDLSMLENCRKLKHLGVYEFDERCAEVNDLYYAQFEEFQKEHPYCVISYASNGEAAYY